MKYECLFFFFFWGGGGGGGVMERQWFIEQLHAVKMERELWKRVLFPRAFIVTSNLFGGFPLSLIQRFIMWSSHVDLEAD